MTDLAISNIQLEDIDILAEKVQSLSKTMMVINLDDFDNQDCGDLHHDCFIVCYRSAKKIREKLKAIENGTATD